MRILGFHACVHDASAAVFDDYKLVAAVQEERLTRIKGWGDGIPWLAIDEVLQIAGWSRRDVDVIAMGCGTFPTRYLRFSLPRDLYYTAERWLGREAIKRDIVTVAYRRGIGDPAALFRFDEFIRQNLRASNDPREVVTDPHARYFGAELRERSLVPGEGARLGETRFAEWLKHSVLRAHA